jgi:hypothetical protein
VEFRDSRLPERFWAKISVQANGCWYWTGTTYGRPNITRGSSRRYGSFRYKGTMRGAHVVAWEAHGDRSVPAGLMLDHFWCDTPICCNPGHVRPVTPRENRYRSTQVISRKSACPSGHPYDCDSYKYPDTGFRRCRECNRLHMAKKRAEYKKAGLPRPDVVARRRRLAHPKREVE